MYARSEISRRIDNLPNCYSCDGIKHYLTQ
uniref:Uncharacterized protein n=1 Tax=Arundo donax TaxID=35708 RepID=A0A0A9HGW0_ARUDO